MDNTSRRIDPDITRTRGAEENDIANRAAPARAAEKTRAYAAGESGEGIDADTRRIREEIENTRGDMSETIDAIQEKLKPANIVANATERVKSATTERVRDMADTASQAAQQAMDYGREAADSVVDTARQNPIPLALLGVGAAWWLVSRSTSSSNRRFDNSGYGSEYGGSSESRRSERPDATRAIAQATARTREYAADAADSVQRIARQRKNQLQRTLEQNPLLVGASALILGAAIGLAVPETDTENEWMGDARDNVVDRARDVARGAANKVEEVAGSVAEEALRLTERSQP
jgi:hypothetical protein